jgi:hypothetical protein
MTLCIPRSVLQERFRMWKWFLGCRTVDSFLVGANQLRVRLDNNDLSSEACRWLLQIERITKFNTKHRFFVCTSLHVAFFVAFLNSLSSVIDRIKRAHFLSITFD